MSCVIKYVIKLLKLRVIDAPVVEYRVPGF